MSGVSLGLGQPSCVTVFWRMTGISWSVIDMSPISAPSNSIQASGYRPTIAWAFLKTTSGSIPVGMTTVTSKKQSGEITDGELPPAIVPTFTEIREITAALPSPYIPSYHARYCASSSSILIEVGTSTGIFSSSSRSWMMSVAIRIALGLWLG